MIVAHVKSFKICMQGLFYLSNDGLTAYPLMVALTIQQILPVATMQVQVIRRVKGCSEFQIFNFQIWKSIMFSPLAGGTSWGPMLQVVILGRKAIIEGTWRTTFVLKLKPDHPRPMNCKVVHYSSQLMGSCHIWFRFGNQRVNIYSILGRAISSADRPDQSHCLQISALASDKIMWALERPIFCFWNPSALHRPDEKKGNYQLQCWL